MVMPYLRFHGDCEEAFRFYMECFDGSDLAKLAVGGTVVSEFHPHPPPDDDGGGAHVIDKYGYSWFLCA